MAAVYPVLFQEIIDHQLFDRAARFDGIMTRSELDELERKIIEENERCKCPECNGIGEICFDLCDVCGGTGIKPYGYDAIHGEVPF